MSLCTRIRTKNCYGDMISVFGAWNAATDSTACYWCLETMQAWGPDERPVDPAACVGERTCYVPALGVEPPNTS